MAAALPFPTICQACRRRHRGLVAWGEGSHPEGEVAWALVVSGGAGERPPTHLPPFLDSPAFLEGGRFRQVASRRVCRR